MEQSAGRIEITSEITRKSDSSKPKPKFLYKLFFYIHCNVSYEKTNGNLPQNLSFDHILTRKLTNKSLITMALKTQ